MPAAFTSRNALLALGMVILVSGCDAGRQSSDHSAVPTAEEMREEASAALAIGNLSRRYIAIAALISHMTPENAPGAGEAFSENLIQVAPCDMRPFANAWGTMAPEAALKYALSLGKLGNQRRREAISEAVSAWALVDRGESAKKFLASIPPESEDYRLVSNNLVMGLATAGYPGEAVPVLAAMPEGETREMLLFRFMRELMRTDSEAIKRFVDGIPPDTPGNLKANAFERGLALIGSIDPDYAREWFDAHRMTSYASGPAVATVLGYLQRTDTQGAIEWLGSLPPSEARDEGLREAVYYWLKDDPQQAEKFLRRALHRSEMASAIFPYAQYVISRDPEEAVEWARRVPHSLERTRVLTQALVFWGRTNREAVIAWLVESPDLEENILEAVVDLLNIRPEELS